MAARKTSNFVSSGLTTPPPDPAPALEIELGPKKLGVGRWVPKEKHRLLAEYLYATREAWRNWDTRVLIDPFCGPGRIRVEGETQTRDGGALVAWRELHAAGVPFTHVFVGDKEASRAHACEQRLQRLGAPAIAFPGLAVDTVKAMVARVPKGALCLAYIDPYNLELLDFEILKALTSLRVDMAIHFSTMDLTRNVEAEYERGRFDAAAPGWQTRIPTTEYSKPTMSAKFFEDWRALITGDLQFAHSKEMPLIHNHQGKPIYRMVFFARHSLPLRIWGDVARNKTRPLFEDE